MVNRKSALDGHYHAGRFGSPGEPGIRLQLVPDLILHQVAVWPDSIAEAGPLVAAAAGAGSVPGPGKSTPGDNGVILRIEPLKWWLVGIKAPDLAPELGATIDLSHSRTRVRICGADTSTLLNRFLPIDLGEPSFPQDRVASTAMHHVGVTLWRSAEGYELFIPRGFALSIWEVLFESALQFGVEVI